MQNEHVGSSFDDFLAEEGIKEEVHSAAIKEVLAWQIAEEMRRLHISKAEMARRMDTSRAQLERVLDPHNTTVQLDTMEKAAKALGRKLHLELA